MPLVFLQRIVHRCIYYLYIYAARDHLCRQPAPRFEILLGARAA